MVSGAKGYAERERGPCVNFYCNGRECGDGLGRREGVAMALET